MALHKFLKDADPEVFSILQKENMRQENSLILKHQKIIRHKQYWKHHPAP